MLNFFIKRQAFRLFRLFGCLKNGSVVNSRMGQQGKRREDHWQSAAIVAAAAGYYSAVIGAKQGELGYIKTCHRQGFFPPF